MAGRSDGPEDGLMGTARGPPDIKGVSGRKDVPSRKEKESAGNPIAARQIPPQNFVY
jgi:hypothetical protein